VLQDTAQNAAHNKQTPVEVIIYTDGACRGNPGPGGWGAILYAQGKHAGKSKRISGAEADSTNNRMELTAAIKALKVLRRAARVELHTDSRYVQLGISEWLAGWKQRGWKTAGKKPVKNKDLWQALDEQSQRHQISWHWVKGHSGHPDNELADTLANEAIDKMLEDSAYIQAEE